MMENHEQLVLEKLNQFETAIYLILEQGKNLLMIIENYIKLPDEVNYLTLSQLKKAASFYQEEVTQTEKVLNQFRSKIELMLVKLQECLKVLQDKLKEALIYHQQMIFLLSSVIEMRFDLPLKKRTLY